MSRVFAYCRVSTIDQTTANQVQEIAGSRVQGRASQDDQRDRLGVCRRR